MDLDIISILKDHLATSDAAQRRTWARIIIDEQIDIIPLAEIFLNDQKISNAFIWLLGDVGQLEALYLYKFLPELFISCKTYLSTEKLSLFVTLWQSSGIPPENEGEAIDLLFSWLINPKIKIYLKSRIIKLLIAEVNKYPELLPEFVESLDAIKDQHSAHFGKQVRRILKKILD